MQAGIKSLGIKLLGIKSLGVGLNVELTGLGPIKP
jgi:hypothetical protein